MAYLTKYGTIWGQIPNTAGSVYWVAPSDSYTVDGRAYSASDNNDGLSPERALRRVNRAWALVTANAGDVIVLLPGTHSAANTAGTATSIVANVAGVTMMGLPSGKGNPLGKRSLLQLVLNDQTVNVTAADIEIAHIGFIGNATQTASSYLDFTAAASRMYVHDCLIDFTAATPSTSILGLDALGAAPQVSVEDCVVLSNGAFGAGVDMTATLDSRVQRCDFIQSAGTWAAAITVGAATDRLKIQACNFLATNAATMTTAVDGTGATIASGAHLIECWRNQRVSAMVANFDPSEVEEHPGGSAGPEWRVAMKQITLSTAAVPVTETLFTVNGEVEFRVWGKTTTTVTSGGALTLELGTGAATTSIIGATAVTQLVTNTIWNATTGNAESKAVIGAFHVVNGGDIVHVIRTAAATAGAIRYFCAWRPLSYDGNVIPA